MNSVVIIPARYSSKRFPGKIIADLNGKPVIDHVYQRSIQAELVDRVIIATDDRRIYKKVEGFGGQAVMTSSEHRSGTDRLAEVASELTADFIVNVQGDEPLIRPEMIDQAIKILKDSKDAEMATLASPISEIEARKPDRVKVVLDKNNLALYFSRSKIPYYREEDILDQNFLQHIGLYVYRKDFLLKYTELEPTPLEKAESLEQLRALENGYKIKVGITEHHGPGIDRPEDLKEVSKILKDNGGLN
ncbi:3-deoxy-manno-octulosonate cytidylyltransferase [Halanaerobiaceae bacterium Z-7014]|uniref:3-deoxy-manno-octulosonate cytidylyltransferase n=1 Tax=Halonatronomonas betaini TaxID=2778430 RepID=A0A931AR37_9FIRM|nr:3-deoxy-manno-octulosonate cytidylyltransferase [Halonatronomonas betaini]MBF8437448.1 3-deoxy-manno-octulosonate cytidylyltransferase [Halonatronomonas betaini]